MSVLVLIRAICDATGLGHYGSTMTRFSVIIPTHNRPQFLAQAVQSALDQQDVTLEVLVINDGNQPVQPFSDSRVRVLKNPRFGLVSARNFGITMASGDFISALDDDD